jgi:uncharacterized Zn-finger protein
VYVEGSSAGEPFSIHPLSHLAQPMMQAIRGDTQFIGLSLLRFSNMDDIKNSKDVSLGGSQTSTASNTSNFGTVQEHRVQNTGLCSSFFAPVASLAAHSLRQHTLVSSAFPHPSLQLLLQTPPSPTTTREADLQEVNQVEHNEQQRREDPASSYDDQIHPGSPVSTSESSERSRYSPVSQRSSSAPTSPASSNPTPSPVPGPSPISQSSSKAPRVSVRRKHQCTWDGCQQSFTCSAHLQTHLRIHSGDKPFLCQFEGCTRAFAVKSSLVIHQRTHTGERPFGCEFQGCGKGFRDSASLTKHRRTHTGEKPFICSECGRGFKQSGHLSRHVSRHTRD